MQKWYAVKTFSGYEEKVKTKIEEKKKINELFENNISEIYIPVYKTYKFIRKEIK